MEKELFALLRLGLGNSSLNDEALSDFIMLSEERWERIGKTAQEQGVLGFVLDGIDILDSTKYGLTRKLSSKQKLDWIGLVLTIERGNHHQIAVMNDMADKWFQHGCHVMVMKGQANSIMYPRPEHRSPGDIDCYLFENYTKGNEIAKSIGAKVNVDWYKHSQIYYQGELIENHHYFVHTREGRCSKRLNKVLCDSLRVDQFEKYPGTEVLLPPPMFNALFLTYHAMSHFLEEGVRLKQLLDWAMFLKRDADKIDWEEFYGICEKYHMRRFVDATTDIAVHYLGVKLNNAHISIESPFSHKVLQSTLCDNDYVFSSGKGEWANRWHIVTNLWKYRWKYHQIYQHSILQQLWWYIIGFAFRKE